MQQVLDNLGDLPTSAGAKDIDLLFLRGIMESPTVRSLVKVAHTHGLGASRWRANTNRCPAPSPPAAPSRALLVVAEALKYSKTLTNRVFGASAHSCFFTDSACIAPPLQTNYLLKHTSSLLQEV